MNDWRELLYPLGFLSAIAFSLRMLIQWLSSEAKGKSIVIPLFWKLSLAGNVLLALHAFIQIQFHVCIIQVGNAIISWRNLNLMQGTSKQISLRSTLILLGGCLFATLLGFTLQSHFLESGSQEWFRIPAAPWQQENSYHIAFGWHIMGFFGLALFSSRFWIQWWCAERHHASYLGPAFWWMSLIGESLCLIYFFHINDPVNYIGPLFALIPYTRNLILLNKQKQEFG